MMIRTNGNKGWLEVKTQLALVVSTLAVLAVGWSVASSLILAKVDIGQAKADYAKMQVVCKELKTADSLLDKRVSDTGSSLCAHIGMDSLLRADIVKHLDRIEKKLDRR